MPRIRVFAGPNGSGKSTIIHKLRETINFGAYLNADDIERTLSNKGFLNIDNYNLNLIQEDWAVYSTAPRSMAKLLLKSTKVKISRNILICSITKYDNYLAATITDFLRYKLLQNHKSFSFETVMSHPSKVDLMSSAKKDGYRTYLYYICTESPYININRVNIRVQKGGHPVPNEKIQQRYYRSLELLPKAIAASSRAYIFDNSGKNYNWVAEVTKGVKLNLKVKNPPNWFQQYYLDAIA